uniref:Uncharacterized protein n=1 Tax=Spongospora subterranea TaxID=70186 RepID=A0A0H5QQT7_9EUKA|eukprot:CRZ03987.1 hypothetical protein [Spongospora subterranea]
MRAEQERLCQVIKALTKRLLPAPSEAAEIQVVEAEPDVKATREQPNLHRAQRIPVRSGEFNPPKLTTCTANPWSAAEVDCAVMWINMTISTVRRLEYEDRRDVEIWFRTRMGNKSLVELLASAERMLPDGPYEEVLLYARDRIQGSLEQEDGNRWMEAALAVHQRPDVPLAA